MNKEALYTIVDLKQGEGRTVGLFIGYSFFMGVAVAIFYTATMSLFLIAFDRTMLPKAYIAGGVAVYALGLLTNYIQKRIRFTRLVKILIYFLMVSVASLLLFYEFSDIKWVIFFLFVWNRVFVFVNGITFWTTASKIFNLQQAKRLFGLISAGEVISSIISYFSVPLLLGVLETESLLYIVAVAVGACIVLMTIIVKRFSHELENIEEQSDVATDAKPTEADSWKDFLKNPYYALVFLLAMLPVVGLFFVDFMFAVESKRIYPDKEQLASFLGVFFGFCAIIEILIKTVLYGKLINKYGIALGITLLPITLIFSVTLAVSYGVFYGTTAFFFTFIVLSRFFMSSVRKSINEPSFQILMQPIPKIERTVLQSKIEGGPKALGNIIPGAILLALSSVSFIGTIHIAGFFLLILVGWLLVSMKVQGQYRTVLSSLLTQSKSVWGRGRDTYHEMGRSLTKGKKNPTLNYEFTNFDFIVKLVESPKVPNRILAAELLKESGRYFAYEYLVRLINDDNYAVKKAAILASAAVRKTELWPLIVRQLQSDQLHQSAAYTLLSVGEPAVKELIKAFNRSSEATEYRLRIVRVLREIGGPAVIKFLRAALTLPDTSIQDEVYEALKFLSYHVTITERTYISSAIDDRIALLVWIMACQNDLKKYPATSDIQEALERERRRILPTIFTLLSLLPDAQPYDFISELVLNDDPETYGYLLEVINITLPPEWKEKLLPIFEDRPLAEKLKKCIEYYPNGSFTPEVRLKDIINKHYSNVSCWLKVIALHELANAPGDHTLILAANAVSPDKIIAETALFALYRLNSDRFYELYETMTTENDLFHLEICERVESSVSEHDLMVHKIKVLQQAEVFSDYNEDELMHVACPLPRYVVKQNEYFDSDHLGQFEKSIWLVPSGHLTIQQDSDTTEHLWPFDTFQITSKNAPKTRLYAEVDSELYCIDHQKLDGLRLDSMDAGVNEKQTAAIPG